MALKSAYQIRCSCGRSFTGEAYEYVLAQHDPELKDAILSGEFNRVTCPSCGHGLYVGNDFLYRDETNALSIWVCGRRKRREKEGREKELLEKLRARLECHFTDGANAGTELLAFGREQLVEILLRKDPALRRAEGPSLKKNPAVRLIAAGADDPGYLLLRGRRIRVAIPLRLPKDPALPAAGPGTARKWLKAYGDGLNVHNPYSSLLDRREKSEWDRIRKEEPSGGPRDEFEDFAETWACSKVDARGFRARCPERRKFIDGLAKRNVRRQIRPMRAGRPS